MLTFSFASKSQTRHFLFIQTDDNQLFYVKAKNNVYSSNELGSLIIPNLEEGELLISIGFPSNNWNSLKYKLVIKNKDLAFVLKKSNTNLWSLYDYYTMSLFESLDSSSAINTTNKPVNDFAKILSQVSGVYLESDFSIESKSENLAKELIVLKPDQIKLVSKEKGNSSNNKALSNADSVSLMQVVFKKEDTSYSIASSIDSDSLIQASKKKEDFVVVDSVIKRENNSIINEKKQDTLKKVDFVLSDSGNVRIDSSSITKHQFDAVKKVDLVVSDSGSHRIDSLNLTTHQFDTSKKETFIVSDSGSVKQDSSVFTKPRNDTIKKVDLIVVDSGIVKIDSSIATKSNSDTLFQEVVTSNLKQDTSVIQIIPTIDSIKKEDLIQTKDDNADIAHAATKNIDSIKVESIINKDSVKIKDGLESSLTRKDLVFIENVAIQQVSVSSDSVLITKAIKSPDSISRTEKNRIIQDTILIQNKLLKIKDSVEFKSNDSAFTIPIDTVISNSITDSLLSQNQPVKKDGINDSLDKKEIAFKGDTIKAKQICKEIASDNDFIQLRRSMIKEDEESKMISAALIIFKEKCFSTTQIKNLAVLFLSDGAKYLFLEAALSSTSDIEHFQSLQSILSEEKNIRSFKELINQVKVKE